MAQPALDRFVKRGFVAKQETTEGVDSTPVGGTNGILLFNGACSTAFDKVERQPDRGYFSNYPFGVANKRGIIEGDFEIFCPATPGQVATGIYVQDTILLSAGMTAVKDGVGQTTTYNPISDAIPSATWKGWIVDKKRVLLGSRNNITGLAMKIGDRFKGRVTVQGTYAFSEEALPAITTYGTVPAVIHDDNSTSQMTCADASVSALNLWSKSLSIDFGSTLATKEYTSHRVNSINDRKGTWTMQIARTALADFNPWAVRDAGFIVTPSFTLNETAFLSTTLGIRGQIETITEESIDGDSGWTLSGPLIASDAGGDEFFIQFADSTP